MWCIISGGYRSYFCHDDYYYYNYKNNYLYCERYLCEVSVHSKSNTNIKLLPVEFFTGVTSLKDVADNSQYDNLST